MPVIITNSPQETIEAARRLGTLLRPGDMIAYTGGLGAGKTTFTRGLAMGLGLGDSVSSPTFALVNEYRGERINMYHFDMYRINSEDDLETTGFWDYDFEHTVAVIEWSENIMEFLPGNVIRVSIEPLDGDRRKITIEEDDRFASAWN
ncbi:MAG: tRNA (adenosine(37)-N6)-threonylcarbamoyltransferase complex ATPase subunit type 1 TsaE [Ruminococcus sp.]|nr:tRNA (adenosine(37)-N6)-threonylcarbamoyltransferase complex ATPase subunit type 1 TsaE [Ruminococcus sp.]